VKRAATNAQAKPIMKKILLLALLGLPAFSFAQKKPNIILIMMDDLGYGDLGVYGASQYQTPNLDKMAKEGVRFTHFLSAQAVCSASRAGLLTGRYSFRGRNNRRTIESKWLSNWNFWQMAFGGSEGVFTAPTWL
jgi:hypothetical protein